MLTRLTIWTALVAYTTGEVGRHGRRSRTPGWPRLVWSIGCLCYLAHVTAAFAEHHGWSHAAAHAHVARETATRFGLDWGAGLYVNYAFTLLWVAEATWWWVAPASYASRRVSVERAIQATFLFMVVNGAVVFVEGPIRWLGGGLTAVLLATWWRSGSAGGHGVRLSRR